MRNGCRYCFGGITDTYDGYLDDEPSEILGGPCDNCPAGDAWGEAMEAIVAEQLEDS